MKINKIIFKGINLALAGILSLLGFVGCVKHEPIEYGSPHADYTVKGTVVNKATGKPIEGIRGTYNTKTFGTMYGVIPTPYTPKSYVFTNPNGEFKLTDRFVAGEYIIVDGNVNIMVYLEDVDGEENGLFLSVNQLVDFSKAEQSGKPKNWYEGEYTLNVNFEMDEADNQ